MGKVSKKTIVGLLLIAVITAVFFLNPTPITVEIAAVERRPFSLVIEEQGRTRARDPYTITSPTAGRLLRTDLKEGDKVVKGQIVAQITPSPQDQRSQAFAEANLSSAQARFSASEAVLVEANSVFEQAQSELARREQLFASNLTSLEELESYRQASSVAASRVVSAQSNMESALADVESARSLLIGVNGDNSSSNLTINVASPSDGTIYRVYEENERVIPAGTVLLEISNQDALEVVADLLTQDAVKVSQGDTVRISGWGGDRILDATVQYIEPAAFTKVSSLGVEEQRVNVIIELHNAPENIGAEYRVEVAVVIWQSLEELTIPTSAIFQRSNGWHTFVVNDGEVELRYLLIGYRGREYTQVLNGVDDGESVVVFPSDLINDGVQVTF